MISLEYLTFRHGRQVNLIKEGEISYYQFNDAITCPRSDLEKGKLLRLLKGRKAAFFDVEEAEGTLLTNNPDEDIYYYHRDQLLNKDSSYYREHRFFIDKFANIKFIPIDGADASRFLTIAEAPEIIFEFINKKYNAQFFQLLLSDDDYGIICLIPITRDIFTIAFADYLSIHLTKIIEYLIVANTSIRLIGLRNRRIPFALEEGVYPYHFGTILDERAVTFYDAAKQDWRLRQILNKSRFTEINYDERYVITNGYYYFLPFTSVKTSQYPSFEVMAKQGAQLLRYQPQKNERSTFIEFCSYAKFIDALKHVPEYTTQLYEEELGKCEEYGGKFIIITYLGQVVTGCALEIIDDDAAYISYVFTLPAFRKQGYFSKLLEKIIFYANDNQKTLYLTAMNEVALKGYRGANFQPVGHVLSDEFLQRKDPADND